LRLARTPVPHGYPAPRSSRRAPIVTDPRPSPCRTAPLLRPCLRRQASFATAVRPGEVGLLSIPGVALPKQNRSEEKRPANTEDRPPVQAGRAVLFLLPASVPGNGSPLSLSRPSSLRRTGHLNESVMQSPQHRRSGVMGVRPTGGTPSSLRFSYFPRRAPPGRHVVKRPDGEGEGG